MVPNPAARSVFPPPGSAHCACCNRAAGLPEGSELSQRLSPRPCPHSRSPNTHAQTRKRPRTREPRRPSSQEGCRLGVQRGPGGGHCLAGARLEHRGDVRGAGPAAPHSLSVQQQLGGALEAEPLPLLEGLPALPLLAQVQLGRGERRGRRRGQRRHRRRLPGARLLHRRRPSLGRRLPRRRPAPAPGLGCGPPCAVGTRGRGGGPGGPRPLLPAWLGRSAASRPPHGSRSLARRPLRRASPLTRAPAEPRALPPSARARRPSGIRGAAPAPPRPGRCPASAPAPPAPGRRERTHPCSPRGPHLRRSSRQALRDRASGLGSRHSGPVCTCRGASGPPEIPEGFLLPS